MKRFILSILLLLFIIDLFAQFANYKNDAWKINTLLDTTDRNSLEKLEENIPIVKQTLIQSVVATPVTKKEIFQNQEVTAKLRTIYQNLSIQQTILKQKIKLGEQLQIDLSALSNLQDKKSKYRIIRRKAEIKQNIKHYRKLNNELRHKERNLRLQLFEFIKRTAGEKTALHQLVPYFNMAHSIIGSSKTQPTLDSLKTVIQKKQQIVQQLEKHRDLLKDSIKIKKEKYEIIFDTLAAQKNRLTYNLQDQIQEEAYRYAKLISLEQYQEEENSRLQNTKKQMKTMEVIHHQMRDSLKIHRLALLKLQADSKKIADENKELAIIKEANKTAIQQLEKANNQRDHQTLLLLFTLLLSMVIAWIYSDQKRRELARTGLLLKQKRAQLESTNQELKDRTDALELSHKELQHRVKNNLQKVTNLIYRRLFSVEDPEARSTLSMLQDELGAIALIHQKLYADDTQKLTLINIADYAEELVESIVKQAAIVHIHVEPIYIEMDNAVEIGLMLNELATNAYKYGFPNTDRPEINVHIFIKGHFVILKVQDNGNGFPADFSIDTSTTFGLLAIADIVKRHQNEGSSLKVFNNNGANVEIQLPFDRQLGRLTA